MNEKYIGQTNTSYNTYYPQFGKSFSISSLSQTDIMKFELWDKNTVNRDEYAGSITTSCSEIVEKRMNDKKRTHYANQNHKLIITINCKGF